MPYLTNVADITDCINKMSQSQTLWLDTESANWWRPDKAISLIQVLADPEDKEGDNAYVLDVLYKENLVDLFIQEIMINHNIEKVFHNASYDLGFLGGDQITKNVTCTYQMARDCRELLINCPNLKLKTLAVTLCDFNPTDVSQLVDEQKSDWGLRPLTQTQLWYAHMDVVYLAQVHQRLIAISQGNYVPTKFKVRVKESEITSTVKSKFTANTFTANPKSIKNKKVRTPAPQEAGLEWLVRFGLLPQVLTCLQQSKIKTIAELQILSDRQLLNIKGFQISYLKNIKSSIIAYQQAENKRIFSS